VYFLTARSAPPYSSMVSFGGEPKAQECIAYTLKTGKPLRN
jgi:hypothetical protein